MKPILFLRSRPIGCLIEFTVIFLLMPLYFYFHANRWNVMAALWALSFYALAFLIGNRRLSWREIWYGHGWTVVARKQVLLRFLVSTLLMILITHSLAPQRLLTLPRERPWFWLMIMILYPLLSALPQELLFRSFFFRRYRSLFTTDNILQAVNIFCFAFMHIIFHTIVSPLLCLVAGAFFVLSYQQHRSLKWAMIEHAAYGCMVFTVGIGYYFVIGSATRL